MSLKQVLPLMIIIAISFITCSDDNNPTNPVNFTSDTIQVTYNKVDVIPNTSNTINFSAVLEDVRKPMQFHQYENPDLGWDNGWAEIELEVSGINGTIRLPIDAAPPDSVGENEPGKAVSVDGLKFRLLDLSPFPTEINQHIEDSEYVATIAVELDSNLALTTTGFFPLETGIIWSYSDTLWNNSSILQARVYDINVGELFHDALGSWRQLNYGTDFLYSTDRSVMASGDTIYMRQSGYFRSYGSIPSYAMPFYLDSGPGMDTCQSIMEGDIYHERYVRYIEDTSIVVPAGEFTTVYEYSGHWGYYSDFRIYLAPGVGVIYVEGNGMMYTYKAVLNNYSLPLD